MVVSYRQREQQSTEHRLGEDDVSAPVADEETQLLQMLQAVTKRLGRVPLKMLVSETVGLIERHYIEAALESTAGNRSAAAKMLGLSRQSLYMKLARYDIGTED